MDAAQSLADLTAVSSQIEGAVLVEAGGKLIASTFADRQAGERVAETAVALLEAADARAGGERAVELSSVVAEASAGGVFVVRGGDRLVAAVTGAEPTVGLVLYDLKTCLRLAEEDEPAAEARAAGDETESALDA
jgi:predicted regulator of Ras-like GTPase activity (Roadblock/LC7/MglB family)